jgi:hypothetical protein
MKKFKKYLYSRRSKTMKKQKPVDFIIIIAGVWSILFIGIETFNIVTKKNG